MHVALIHTDSDYWAFGLRIISAVLKGNYAFLEEIPKTLSKRKLIQKTRQISDEEMERMGLIASLNWCLKEYRRLGKIK